MIAAVHYEPYRGAALCYHVGEGCVFVGAFWSIRMGIRERSILGFERQLQKHSSSVAFCKHVVHIPTSRSFRCRHRVRLSMLPTASFLRCFVGLAVML